ncbi:MAG: protein kinase [bacterium]
MIGQSIGDYRITDKLGEGGFGVVYKAVHRLLEQEVAMKTLDAILTRDVRFRQRFFEEAKTQARLKHPNIVTLHNFFEHDGQYYIVMEYLEGMVLPGGQRAKNLGDLVKLGPVPEARTREIFRQILEGVSCAHRHGVLHRDIKPLNILFAESGLVKIADFGIAKIIGGDTNISLSGTRVGTPAYMSPEQVLNRPLDARTDIYSLGCVLYELAAGAMPFQATSTTSMEEQHLSVPPPPPRQRNPWLSETMERAILKAMAKKPEERFQSCEEFAEALADSRQPEERGLRPAADSLQPDEEKGRHPPAHSIRPEAVMRKTIPDPVAAVPEEEVRSEEGRVKRAGGGKRSAEDTHHPPRRKAVLVIGIAAVLVVAVVGGVLLARRQPTAGFVLPELAGVSLASARRLAQEQGLVLVAADSVLADDAAPGAVVTARPAAGAPLNRGDTVRVTWCWGRRTCPDCGTTRKAAARFCTRCGHVFQRL